MTAIEILRLNLISPLYYAPQNDADPFNYKEGGGEKLFCFELDKAKAQEFEPDITGFLGKPVFCGQAAGGAGGESCVEFPPGNYLFAQKREILSREGIAGMAAEIQQEGLWQRVLLGEKLYLRYLFEDGCSVTQLFRPYAEP